MTSLITADLHLTDSPRDEYRWNLFPWMREQVKKHKVQQVFLLGDLTDAKDRHSSRLVNRFVKEVAELSRLCPVIAIKGNHDFVDENNPFFHFLSEIQNVTFFVKPSALDDDFLLLPHTKNYQEDWHKWEGFTHQGCKYILCHQTFDGAKAENGQELRGIPPSFFKSFKGQVYSGDIHVPQKVSRNIEYVGAPYRVHFGDSFRPRVLLLRKGEAQDLHFPGKSRELLVGRNLRDLQQADLAVGTQVKMRMLLKRSEYPEWPKLRKEIAALAKERQWEVCGVEVKALASKDRKLDEDEMVRQIEPSDTLRLYAETKKLSKAMRATGLEILKEAQ